MCKSQCLIFLPKKGLISFFFGWFLGATFSTTGPFLSITVNPAPFDSAAVGRAATRRPASPQLQEAFEGYCGKDLMFAEEMREHVLIKQLIVAQGARSIPHRL